MWLRWHPKTRRRCRRPCRRKFSTSWSARTTESCVYEAFYHQARLDGSDQDVFEESASSSGIATSAAPPFPRARSNWLLIRGLTTRSKHTPQKYGFQARNPSELARFKPPKQTRRVGLQHQPLPTQVRHGFWATHQWHGAFVQCMRKLLRGVEKTTTTLWDALSQQHLESRSLCLDESAPAGPEKYHCETCSSDSRTE